MSRADRVARGANGREVGETFAAKLGSDRRALGRRRDLDVEHRTEQRCEREHDRARSLIVAMSFDSCLHGVERIDAQEVRNGPRHAQIRIAVA